MTEGELLRDRSGDQRATNIELFFDLVYVFAVTQLSHFLLAHATPAGVLRAAVGSGRRRAPGDRPRRMCGGRDRRGSGD